LAVCPKTVQKVCPTNCLNSFRVLCHPIFQIAPRLGTMDELGVDSTDSTALTDFVYFTKMMAALKVGTAATDSMEEHGGATSSEHVRQAEQIGALCLMRNGPLPNLERMRFRLIQTPDKMERTRLEKYDETGAYTPLTPSECSEPAFWGNTLTLHTTLFRDLEDIDRTYTSDKPYFTCEQLAAHVLEFEDIWRRIERGYFSQFTHFRGLARTLDPNTYRVRWTT